MGRCSVGKLFSLYLRAHREEKLGKNNPLCRSDQEFGGGGIRETL